MIFSHVYNSNRFSGNDNHDNIVRRKKWMLRFSAYFLLNIMSSHCWSARAKQPLISNDDSWEFRDLLKYVKYPILTQCPIFHIMLLTAPINLKLSVCYWPEKVFKSKLLNIYIQCPPLILAPLINMSKGGCENKSALFILLIFHSINSQNSNLSLK